MKDKTTRTLIQILIIMSIIFLFIKIKPSILPVLEIVGMLIIPIIIGTFLFYALRPLKKLIGKKVKKDSIAAILSILIVLILIGLFFVYGGAVVKEQFEDTFIRDKNQILDYKKYVEMKFREILPDFNLLDRINDDLKNLLSSIGSNAMGIFSSVGDITSQILLIPLIMFYLLKDGKLFREKFFSKIPKEYKGEIKNLSVKIDKILSTYINGQLLVATMIGVLMFIGYLIIGMPNALLMASFAVLTSVIPVIGAFLGVLPALLISLTINYGLAIKVIIITVIVQQIESNFISPKIMADRLKLHPLAVIIIVIVSIKLFGILGAIIGTPLFLVTVNLFQSLHRIIKKPRL